MAAESDFLFQLLEQVMRVSCDTLTQCSARWVSSTDHGNRHFTFYSMGLRLSADETGCDLALSSSGLCDWWLPLDTLPYHYASVVYNAVHLLGRAGLPVADPVDHFDYYGWYQDQVDDYEALLSAGFDEASAEAYEYAVKAKLESVLEALDYQYEPTHMSDWMEVMGDYLKGRSTYDSQLLSKRSLPEGAEFLIRTVWFWRSHDAKMYKSPWGQFVRRAGSLVRRYARDFPAGLSVSDLYADSDGDNLPLDFSSLLFTNTDGEQYLASEAREMALNTGEEYVMRLSLQKEHLAGVGIFLRLASEATGVMLELENQINE